MALMYAWRLITREPTPYHAPIYLVLHWLSACSPEYFSLWMLLRREMTATAIAPVKLDIIVHATKPDVMVTDMLAPIRAQRGIYRRRAFGRCRFHVRSKSG